MPQHREAPRTQCPGCSRRQNGVLEDPAGESDQVKAHLYACSPGEVHDHRHDGCMETGRGGLHGEPGRQIPHHRPDDRRRVDNQRPARPLPAQGERVAFAVVRATAGRGPRPGLQLDRRLRLEVDLVTDAEQRADRVEEPPHAGGRHAAQPAGQLVGQRPPLRLRAGDDRRQGGIPADSGGVQMGKRHPAGPPNRGVPTGKRHIAQVGEAPEPVVVGDQHFAAPHGPVGAVAGPVKGESHHRPGAVEAVLGHQRGHMSMVVLHGPYRSAGGVPHRPLARPVARVRVGDELAGG